MRPAPTVTNSFGRMCFRVMEDRNELLPQEFSQGSWIGRRLDRTGRGIGFHRGGRSGASIADDERERFVSHQRKAARRRIRSAHHVVGSDRDERWPDGDQSKLQSGQLRRMQRIGGWGSYLLLSYAGD